MLWYWLYVGQFWQDAGAALGETPPLWWDLKSVQTFLSLGCCLTRTLSLSFRGNDM